MNADQLAKTIKRHTHAVEQLAKIAHYVDRSAMGRPPTESELAEFTMRSREVETALRKLCACPCPDFATLRRKARYLSVILKDASLGQQGERSLVESILQMPRANDAA